MLKIHETEKVYADKLMLGCHDAFALGAASVKNSFIIFHGVAGCRMAMEQVRMDNVPQGTFTPIRTTSPLESHIIQGGTHLIERTWRYANEEYFKKKKPDVVWFITSCATSINEDDLFASVEAFEKETGIKAIAVDTPNFLGDEATGLDLVYSNLVSNFAEKGREKKKGKINIVGTHLIGSKNFAWDIREMIRLLNLAEIEVNCVLTLNTKIDDVKKFGEAEACYMLTGEDLPEFFTQCQELDMEVWGRDLVLPYGIANTEEWYLKMAQRFGSVEKAKSVMRAEVQELRDRLRMDYNASWAMSDPSSKRAGIIAYAPFATAMARMLYYDFNVKPVVVALISETPEAIDNVEKSLKELGQYVDIDVYKNPSHDEYGRAIKGAIVDFTIGRRFDRVLSEGMDIPHLSLGGRYLMNQFNFVPWPMTGFRGTLQLLTEITAAMERMRDAAYRENWKELSFIGHESQYCYES